MIPPSPYYSDTAFGILTPLAVVYSLAAHVWTYLGSARRDASSSVLPSGNNQKQTRIAIVTGSNTGIGYETARSLAVDYGMTVVLACRSRDKGLQAAAQIEQEAKKSQQQGSAAFVHPLDLSSPQSIQEFVAAVKEKYSKIDILVNNAGRNSNSPDPIEGTTRDALFQTNFLGHFELTAALMDILAPKARVVNLASVMHHFVNGNVNEVSFWKDCLTHNATTSTSKYAASKLAAILFTCELNRKYGHRIEAVAVNPGGV